MRQLICIGCVLLGLKAQGQTRSFGIWTSVSTGVEVFKDFDVSIEEGFRSADFMQDFWYQDLTAKYKFNDYFKLAGTWRYGGRGALFNVDAIDNRFQIDATGEYEIIEDLELNVRLRYQSRYRDMLVSDDGLIPSNHLRVRPSVAYKVSGDFLVDLGYEANFGVNNVEDNFYDRFRLYAGFDMELGDYHDLGVRYIFQRDVQVANPETNNILSFAYSFSLGKFFKDRKEPDEVKEKQVINWYRLPPRK